MNSVRPLHLLAVLDRLRAQGERAYKIGAIEVKGPEEPALAFSPLPDGG